jgi:citrate lyase subunit gamma (acyl carrier protein)
MKQKKFPVPASHRLSAKTSENKQAEKPLSIQTYSLNIGQGSDVMPENTVPSNGTVQCGTLESSDCLVTLSASETLRLDYRGGKAALFRDRTEALARELLSLHGLKSVAVSVQDNGALEVTLRARLETAIERFLQGR